MNTLIFSVNSRDPEPHVMQVAATNVLAGGLVAFPTETVYGLGANAFNPEAVHRIFAAKRRPDSDPIIVHIAEPTQLDTIAQSIPTLAWQLAQHFWPGPLTLVLPRHPNVPRLVSAGLDTVAVRMPHHPVAAALLQATGVPIGAPSANLFTRPSPTTAQHVLEDLYGRIDIVLDGGATTIGLESTVVDMTKDVPIILRPGGITLEALRTIIPSVQFAPQHLKMAQAESPAASPGMLAKHYAPRAELLLFTGSTNHVLTHMQETVQRLASLNKKVGVLAPNEERDWFVQESVSVVSLGSWEDLGQIGQNLFAGIRTLDQWGADVILVRSFDQQGLGQAIWDRLFRAAEGRVIEVSES